MTVSPKCLTLLQRWPLITSNTHARSPHTGVMVRLVCASARVCLLLTLLLACAIPAIPPVHAEPVPEFYTRHRVRFGETVRAPIAAVMPAWTFDAQAGATLVLHTTGAGLVRLRGPKVLGGDWNTIWDHRPPASARIQFNIPRSGRYGVFITPTPGAPVTLRLECASQACARSAWQRSLPPQTLGIIAVGDTGLQPHKAKNDRFGGYKYDEYHLYTEMLEGFERFLDDGDLKIANIETAVTTSHATSPKRYNFRMHPRGLSTLAQAGFDAFAMANNHAGDYRERGPTR